VAAKSILGSNWLEEAPTNSLVSNKPSECQTNGAETKAVNKTKPNETKRILGMRAEPTQKPARKALGGSL